MMEEPNEKARIAKRSRTKTAVQLNDLPKKITIESPRTKRTDEKYCISDISLEKSGLDKIEKAKDGLFGLLIIKEVNKNSMPLKGAHIVGCSQINSQSAILIETLHDFGASISWCSSNINTIEDDICAYLVSKGISLFAWYGENEDDYQWCIEQSIENAQNNIHFIIDDGGDLSNTMLSKYPKMFHNLKGIIESNSYGIYRLYNMVKSQQLLVPAMNISNSVTLEHYTRQFYFRECLIKCFDIANENLLCGKRILICGYGHRGKGCSKHLRTLGATIYVTEIDPICAIQACSEGIEVVTLESVISIVDAVILCTENKDIIGYEQLESMKNNCLIINYGHSSSELNIESIKKNAISIDTSEPNILRVILPSKKSVKIMFNGEPVQSVSFKMPNMILSIQNSIITVAILELNLFSRDRYQGGVYLLPRKLDEYIALIHLKAFSACLTKIDDAQAEFLGIPKEGPYKSHHYRY